MLVGREPELGLIDALIAGAREARSASLLLLGEPGIGKSALLDAAVARANGFEVSRTRGIESEAALEFSGLHDMCGPFLHRLEKIPERQADALRGSLGLAAAEPSDRFLVGVATLSLLAACAEREPLLVIVDDVQWLDESSRDALLFVSRRLDADRVLLLFAAREDEGDRLARAGVETTTLTGLDAAAATQLLERTGDGVSAAVATRLHDSTAGNPLAMSELLPLLSPAQRAGEEVLEAPLPAGRTVERAFAGSAAGLPESTRTALLVAATAMTTRSAPILRATSRLGGDVFEPAEDAGLVRLEDGRIEFRHPLVRSAIHSSASRSEVRAAHRALAAASQEADEVEQHAWHLAGAATGPDPEAADALAAVAELARRRSGYGMAAAALERAASLTPDLELRLRRLLGAAEAAWLGGEPARAMAILDHALTHAASGQLRGAALRLRGSIEYFAGRPGVGSVELLEASRLLVATDREAAVGAAADAVNAAVPAADSGLMLAAADQAREFAADDGSPADLEARIALGYALSFNGRIAEGEPLVRSGVEMTGRRQEVDSPLQIGRLAWALGGLGRHREAQQTVAVAVTLARGSGALSPLPFLLGASAWHRIHLGDWRQAYAESTEALELAAEVDQPLAVSQALSLLAWQEGLRGEEARCRARAAEAIDRSRDLGLRLYELLAWLGLGILEVGLGNWEAAVEPLRESAGEMDARGFYVAGLCNGLELATVLCRCDRADEAQAILDAFLATEPAAVPLQAAIAARLTGLLAKPVEAGGHLKRAQELHPRGDYPFELARTELALGEGLRRAGQRTDARVRLRAALATFERLGATNWSLRARDELEASGETTIRRDPEHRDDLTARELQVAGQVAEGKTNKEAAAVLFLSPKTIEYHLKHVYGKLGIRSRGELIRLFATNLAVK